MLHVMRTSSRRKRKYYVSIVFAALVVFIKLSFRHSPSERSFDVFSIYSPFDSTVFRKPIEIMMNGTNNVTANDLSLTRSTHQPLSGYDSWSILGAFTIIVMAGIAAGSYEIWALLKDKNWANFHMLLLSITVVDLISIVFDFPGFVIVSVIHTGQPWPLGKAACVLWQYIDWFTNPTNVLLAAALQLDHFLLVRRKTQNEVPQKSVTTVILTFLGISVVSTLMCLPVIIMLTSPDYRNAYCSLNHYDYPYYLMAFFVGGFVLPFLFIISYTAFLVIQLLREKEFFTGKSDVVRFTLTPSGSEVKLFPDNNTTVKGHVHGADVREVHVTMGALFLVCYGPWSVCGLLGYWVPGLQSNAVSVSTYWLVMLFPVIHPVVLFLCRWKCQSKTG